MSWWGKLIGGVLGYLLGDYIGAVLGVIVGHQFDRGLQIAMQGYEGGATSGSEREHIQTVFFTTVFSVMGHLAKIDGRVSEDEIEMARRIMEQMRLDETQRRSAIELFSRGKHAGFPLDEVLREFRQVCGRRRSLLQMFIEILLHAAYADGQIKTEERRLLHHICAQLGFSQSDFAMLDGMIRAQRAFHHDGEHARYQQHEPARPSRDLIQEAYQMLGVTASASDSEVKRAYRKLMNQHHPDKLVSKGLPQEMIRIATEKTQEIQAAYDTICQVRGIK